MKQINEIFKILLSFQGETIDTQFYKHLSDIYQRYLLTSRLDPKVAVAKAILELESFIQQHKIKSKDLGELLQQNIIEEAYHPLVSVELFPGLPAKVNPNHIMPNGKIISEENISKLTSKTEGEIIMVENYPVQTIKGLHYGIYTKLGQGDFGQVSLAQELESGKWCVIKTLKLKDQDIYKMYQQEVEILLELEQYVTDTEDKTNEVAIIGMEFKSGVTLDHLVSNNDCAFIWLKRIISMLEKAQKLHDKHILHCDLKLANMMCDEEDVISFIDNGISLRLDQSNHEIEVNNIIIPRSYFKLASETKHRRLSPKTEVCILGYIIGELLGVVEASSAYPDLKAIVNVEQIKKLSLSPQLSKKVIEFLKEMTAFASEDRPPLKKCILFFKDIQSQCLESFTYFKKVGFCKLDELVNEYGEINKDLLLSLRMMDKVYIVRPVGMQMKSLDALLTNVCKAGVRVRGLINPKEKDLWFVDAVKGSIQKIESNNLIDCVNEYYCFTCEEKLDTKKLASDNVIVIPIQKNKALSEYLNEVKVQHKLSLIQFLFVIDTLQAELDRLDIKYKEILKSDGKDDTNPDSTFSIIKSQKQQLEETIRKFSLAYASNELSCQAVIDALESVQNSVKHTNSVKRFFATQFNLKHSTTGADNIKALKEKVQAPTLYIPFKS